MHSRSRLALGSVLLLFAFVDPASAQQELHYTFDYSFSNDAYAPAVFDLPTFDWALGDLVYARAGLSGTYWASWQPCVLHVEPPDDPVPSTTFKFALHSAWNYTGPLFHLQDPSDVPLDEWCMVMADGDCSAPLVSSGSYQLGPETVTDDWKLFFYVGGTATVLAYPVFAEAQDVDCSVVPLVALGAPLIVNHDEISFSSTGQLSLTLGFDAVESGQWTSPTGWTNLGHGLAGTHGEPSLIGSGALTPDSPFELVLHGARESSPGAIVVGTSAIYAPFLGGTLVPAVGPPGFTIGLSTDAAGASVLQLDWPPGAPPGATFYLQGWVYDPLGPQGFAASNAIELTTP